MMYKRNTRDKSSDFVCDNTNIHNLQPFVIFWKAYPLKVLYVTCNETATNVVGGENTN